MLILPILTLGLFCIIDSEPQSHRGTKKPSNRGDFKNLVPVWPCSVFCVRQTIYHILHTIHYSDSVSLIYIILRRGVAVKENPQ